MFTDFDVSMVRATVIVDQKVALSFNRTGAVSFVIDIAIRLAEMAVKREPGPLQSSEIQEWRKRAFISNPTMVAWLCSDTRRRFSSGRFEM